MEQIAIATALPGFNNLGDSVTSLYLLMDHSLHRFSKLTTASCCMEDGCLGYPEAATMTGQPLDSSTLHDWQFLQPNQAPTQSSRHPSTHHTELTVETRRRVGRKMSKNRPKMCRKINSKLNSKPYDYLIYKLNTADWK